MKKMKRDFKFKDAILINFINLNYKEREMVRGWRNNNDIRKWMYSNHNISIREHREFLERIKEDNRNFYWITKKITGEYVGVISLNNVDFRNKNVYMGIYKCPDCKLSGAGHLLIECLKKLVFDIAKLHTLRLEAVDANKGAIEFYKREGFKKEGKLKEAFFINDKWHDVIIMGLIRKNKRHGT